MENIKIAEVKIKAFVIEDKTEGVFTIALANTGGPIISAPTYKEACDKFEEALDLSCAIQNLLTYKDAVKSADASILIKVRKSNNVEYITLAA